MVTFDAVVAQQDGAFTVRHDVNSGKVVYKLMETMEGVERLHEPYPDGWFYDSDYVVQCALLVRMVDSERIRLEIFRGDGENPSFTSKYYVR